MIRGLFCRGSTYFSGIDFEYLEQIGITDIFSTTWTMAGRNYVQHYKPKFDRLIQAFDKYDTNLKLHIDFHPFKSQISPYGYKDYVKKSPGDESHLNEIKTNVTNILSEYPQVAGICLDDFFYPPGLNGNPWIPVKNQINEMVNFAEELTGHVHDYDKSYKLSIATSPHQRWQVDLAKLAPVVDNAMPEIYKVQGPPFTQINPVTGIGYCSYSNKCIEKWVKYNMSLVDPYTILPIFSCQTINGSSPNTPLPSADLIEMMEIAISHRCKGYVFFIQTYLTSNSSLFFISNNDPKNREIIIRNNTNRVKINRDKEIDRSLNIFSKYFF